MAGAKRRVVDKRNKCYPMPNLPAIEHPARESEWIRQYRIGYYDTAGVYPNQYSLVPQPQLVIPFLQPSKEDALLMYQNQTNREQYGNRTQVSIRINPDVFTAARKANLNVSRICEDALAQMVATVTTA